MDLRLSGKVAIVTGGSRGIGYAAAETLLGEGASVVIASRHPESVTSAVARLALRGQVMGSTVDVSSEPGVMRLVQETVTRFGRIDIMVANAGISGKPANLTALDIDSWDRMLAVHMRGTLLCGREAARAMRQQDRPGRIVTVASTSGYQGDRDMAHYNAAKAGVISLTRSMAIDFADWGIRVNGVAPGWVYTDMTSSHLPSRGTAFENSGVLTRAAETSEIAAAIAFLASDVCDFMTGAILVVDGGQLIVAPQVQRPDERPGSSAT